MTDTKTLLGALSNDLYRVAVLMERGSFIGAERFFLEAQKNTQSLLSHTTKPYIRDIVVKIHDVKTFDCTDRALAETYLMYSTLLQNYTLHMDI